MSDIASKEKKKTAAKPVVFSKSKILTLDRFANRRDLLSVLLEDGQNYTLDQVSDLIENFMNPKKGKVK